MAISERQLNPKIHQALQEARRREESRKRAEANQLRQLREAVEEMKDWYAIPAYDDIAHGLGVSRQTLDTWLNGRTKGGFESHVLQLAAFFGVADDQLLFEKPKVVRAWLDAHRDDEMIVTSPAADVWRSRAPAWARAGHLPETQFLSTRRAA